ncbi:MAG TPA: efflux RND transporter periplasmic adaptor subunit [Rickettsiales bacterium]|nr:efflux RND transporter periplasmic adaptor subunit [Rickettsiales bacterium]
MTQFSLYIRNKALLLAGVAIIILPTAGFAIHGLSKSTPPAAAASQAVPVDVQTVNPQNIRIWSAFSGRMRAVDYAEIRPEVSGRIASLRFNDGQVVKAGDVLMVIEPQPYEAAVAKAEANLAAATTKAAFARTELDRATHMIKSQAIAKRVYDERANDNRVAQADVKAAEAALKQAKVDLDHAYVKAPISGRVSRAEITVGNLVQSGSNAPLLTSIVSNDGIYADFEVDEQTYMRSIRSHAATQNEEQSIPVELAVQGDEKHLYKGTVYSFDNHIDTGSGTIRARAKFANEDGSLVPGMMVSVKLASNMAENVLLVPNRAIGNDQNKRFVYVVGNDNKVAYREVSLGEQADESQRIVLSGLNPGDKVIVDGLQHVRPDAVVQPKEAVAHKNAADKVAAN